MNPQMQDIPNGLPSDQLDENLADQRKRELALLLLKNLQQNRPTVQQPPGSSNAPGILARLPMSAVLLNAGAQGLAQADIASADQAIGQRKEAMQQDYLRGVQEFQQNPDKAQGIAKLMASQNPLLRQLADAQAKVMRDQEEKEKERAATLAGIQGKILGETGQVGESSAVLAAGKPNPAVQGRTPQMPTTQYIGNPDDPKAPKSLAVTNYGKDGVPHMTVSGSPMVTVNNGNERALNRGVGDLTIESFKENLNAAKGAYALNNQLARLESLSQDGIVSGPATVPMTWITGMLNAAGLPVDKAKLANTQEFNAVAEQATQAMIAGMQGGNRGITGEESKRIMGMLPMAAHSAEARAQITAELRAINQRRIDGFKEQAATISQAMKDGNFDNLEGLLLPPSLGAGKPPAAPTSPAVKPAASPSGTLPGGQTPEVLKERIRIVQGEFDREPPGPTKEALGRELARLQKDLGTPSAASPASGLSPAEADELAKLRARFSKGK